LSQKLPTLHISVIQDETGLYKYVSQIFTTRKEAVHWMQLINALGWKDCFLKKEETSSKN